MVKNIWFYFLYCWRGFPNSHLTSTCSKSTTETLEKVFSPFSSVSIVDFEKPKTFFKLLKAKGFLKAFEGRG